MPFSLLVNFQSKLYWDLLKLVSQETFEPCLCAHTALVRAQYRLLLGHGTLLHPISLFMLLLDHKEAAIARAKAAKNRQSKR